MREPSGKQESASILRMRMRRRETITLGILGAVLATTFLLYTNHSPNSDVYLLLAGGRHVATHGYTNVDPFNTIAQGSTWYNQQWLTEWLFYQAQHFFGFKGLEFLYAMLIGLGFVPLASYLRHKPLVLSISTLLLSLGSLIAVLNPRAAGLSLILFCLLLVLTHKGGWWVWLTIPLFVLWANLHGSFVAGFLLLGALAVGAFWERNNQEGLKYLVIIGATIVATLITPMGFHVVEYMKTINGNPVLLQFTNEWKPTINTPAAFIYSWLFLGFSLGVLFYRKKKFGDFPRSQLLLVLAFFAFSLTSGRQIIWLGAIMIYLVGTLPISVSHAYLVKRKNVLAALSILGVCGIGFWATTAPATKTDPDTITESADYMSAHQVCGRVVVPAGTGSYLLWRNPEAPITIDGRFEHYSAPTVRTNYALLRAGNLGYVKKWNIGSILTRNPRAVRLLTQRGFKLRQHKGLGYYLTRNNSCRT